jgi:DNA polymerase/3'-5' exonuclease PolX
MFVQPFSGPSRRPHPPQIADRLMSLSQLLTAQKENPFKVKAYRRARQQLERCPRASMSWCEAMRI